MNRLPEDPELEAIDAALASLTPPEGPEGDSRGRVDPLRLADRLRGELGPERGRLAAELATLRARARDKLDRPERLWLTARHLEQASHRDVAHARARQIAELEPGARVLDATAGIGSDTLALLAVGLDTWASELSVPVARLLRRNLELEGAGQRALVADARRPPLRADVGVLDPDRRSRTGARVGPEAWSPSWPEALVFARRFRGANLKLAPGLDPPEVPAELACHWEWTSLDGELRELALWCGSLARPGGGERVARLLRSGSAEAVLVARPVEVPALSPVQAEEVAWLAETDPAVLRAGLLGNVALEHGLAPLSLHLAYLGGAEEPARSAFLTAYRVLDSTPLDRRRVRALLAKHDVGPITVKKRGHSEPAEKLARRFRGRGRQPGLLVVARLDAGHRAYLVERRD